MLKIYRLFLLAALVFLTSCGGGSSDSEQIVGWLDPDEEFGDFTRAERWYLHYEIPFEGDGARKRLDLLQPLFEANDLYAIKIYAQAYSNAMGGKHRDIIKANSLYTKAAEMGDPVSMVVLGGAHYYGRGAAQNYKKALAWYQKSYDLAPSSRAAGAIRRFYWDGHGPGGEAENKRIAKEWEEKAGQAGLNEDHDISDINASRHLEAIRKQVRKEEALLMRFHEADFKAIEARAAGKERDAETLTKLGTIKLGKDRYWPRTIYKDEVLNPAEGIVLLEQAFEIETRRKKRYSLAKTIERYYGPTGVKEIQSADKVREWNSKAEAL